MFGFLANVGFALVDTVNQKLDPYDDFTRPFMPPEQQDTLREKAFRFLKQLQTDFRTPT
jgi:hypothetical protein